MKVCVGSINVRKYFIHNEKNPDDLLGNARDFENKSQYLKGHKILNYPEKNTDAFLRSIIQSLNNIRFIFSGSQQHLMTQLFADPSRPFYQSAGFLKIDKIQSDTYAAFIEHHFQEAGINAGMETIQAMLDWADHHTYYVQLHRNSTWAAPQQCYGRCMLCWKRK